MPNVLNAQGLQTATQAELLAFFTASYQQIYGADIVLDSSTPDGQLMNIFIQSILDVQDLLTQIYNSFDPDNALGVVLDQRVAINGIEREGGTSTITNITIVTSQSVNLFGLDQATQAIYTVSDQAGNQWQLISTQTGVTAGTHVFAFQSSVPGAVLTIPNTITIPVTIVLGVSSVNNPTTYTSLGTNEETDAALKIRRRNSVSLSSQGYLQGLLGLLKNINGLTSVLVYENNGSITDGNGVPGHSIWVIVSGNPDIALSASWLSLVSYSYGQIVSAGSVNYISWQNNNLGNDPTTNPSDWGIYNPIAQAIYAKRNAACGMFGEINYTITQVDGTQFIISYDQVNPVDLFIQFTASSLDGIHAPNIAAIIEGLPTIYTPDVNAEVNINQMSTLVQEIDSNTLVLNSGFSFTATGSYTVTLTPVSKKDQFVVSTADIIILPMILSAPIATSVIVNGLVTHTIASIASGGNTIQFTGLGGHGNFTYSMQSGSGSINSSTGLY